MFLICFDVLCMLEHLFSTFVASNAYNGRFVNSGKKVVSEKIVPMSLPVDIAPPYAIRLYLARVKLLDSPI